MTSIRKTEPLIETKNLEIALARFAAERDWNRFHSAKNLAMALTGEVGELVELFQWTTEKESNELGSNEKTGRAVRDELADVLLYLVRLATVLEVDLNEAVQDKLTRNAIKYPARIIASNLLAPSLPLIK